MWREAQMKVTDDGWDVGTLSAITKEEWTDKYDIINRGHIARE